METNNLNNTEKSFFYIIDSTNNSNQPYINAVTHKNSSDPDGCLRFENIHDANDFIYDKGWAEWADLEEIFENTSIDQLEFKDYRMSFKTPEMILIEQEYFVQEADLNSLKNQLKRLKKANKPAELKFKIAILKKMNSLQATINKNLKLELKELKKTCKI